MVSKTFKLSLCRRRASAITAGNSPSPTRPCRVPLPPAPTTSVPSPSPLLFPTCECSSLPVAWPLGPPLKHLPIQRPLWTTLSKPPPFPHPSHHSHPPSQPDLSRLEIVLPLFHPLESRLHEGQIWPFLFSAASLVPTAMPAHSRCSRNTLVGVRVWMNGRLPGVQIEPLQHGHEDRNGTSCLPDVWEQRSPLTLSSSNPYLAPSWPASQPRCLRITPLLLPWSDVALDLSLCNWSHGRKDLCSPSDLIQQPHPFTCLPEQNK